MVANGLHILVAEDEALVAMALVEILEAEGFRVTIAHNGQEAIDADAANPANLLLTDLRMPIVSREVVIGTLRKRRPNLPIIIMTGKIENFPEDGPERLLTLHKTRSMIIVTQNIKKPILPLLT